MDILRDELSKTKSGEMDATKSLRVPTPPVSEFATPSTTLIKSGGVPPLRGAVAEHAATGEGAIAKLTFGR